MGKKNGVLAACVLASIAGLGFPGAPVQAEGITFSGSSGGSVTVVTSGGSTVISSDGSGSVTITVPITVTISGGTSTGNNDGTTPASGNTLTVDDGSAIDGAIGGSTVTTVEKAMTDSIKADTVSGNTLTISDGTVSNVAAGGLSIAANVTENEANLSVTDSGTASVAVMAGGISGTGNANTNTLSISGGSVSELAAGGVTDYGGASGNKVTMSGGSVNKLAGGASVGGVTTLSNTLIDDFSSLGSRLDYKGTAGGSTENNEVTMSGGSATYVWGAYNWNLTGTAGNADVNGNQVTISDTAVVNGQVVGGEADAGSADSNAVIIKGGTINGGASGSGPQGMSVIGANTNVAGSGGANTNNSVTISGGTFGETAVQYGNRIIGAYSQSNQEDISGNSVTISGGTFGQAAGSVNYVYGAYDLGTGSTLSKNSVTISGGTLDAKGGYDILIGAYVDVDGTSDTASGNSVSLTGGSIGASGSADTLQIKGAQVNGAGTVSGNSVDINGAAIGSSAAKSIDIDGGIVKTGTVSENKVTIESGTLDTSSSSALRIFGGLAQSSGAATGNEINITGGTIGADSGALYLYGGYTPNGDATGNKIDVSSASLNPNAVFTAAFTGAGTASGNAVSLTGQTGSYASAGQAASGAVSGNTATLDGSTVTLVYGGRIQTAGTSSGNKVTLSNKSATGAAYGGYSPSGDVNENTVDVESGSFANNAIGGWTNSGNATENIAIVNNSKIGSDTVTTYVFGGYSASGKASGSKVTITNSTLGTKTEVYGGYGTTGSSDNSLSLTNTDAADSVIAGFTSSGDADGNKLAVTNGTFSSGVTGGQTGTGNAASNEVNMSGSDITGYIYGGNVTTSGNASTNKVTLTGGSTGSRYIYGGYTKKGAASHNTVSITGTDFTNSYRIYGGYAAGLGTTDSSTGSTYNTVSITDGDTAGSVTLDGGTSTEIYGGYAYKTAASNNEVTFNAENAVIRSIYGGEAAGGGDADGNTVNVNSGTLRALLFAGHAPSGTANHNTLNITGGNIQVNSTVDSGYGKSAAYNQLNISGGTFGRTNDGASLNVAAGEAVTDGGTADNNTLTITGGTFGRQDYENANYINLYGGVSHASAEDNYASFATNNKVSISNAVMNSYGDYVLIAGGYMYKIAASGTVLGSDSTDTVSSEASNNSVEITSGSINDGAYESAGGDINIMGAYTDAGKVTSNSVTISGGTIGTAATGVTQIIGGYTSSGAATSNSVTISGGTLGNPNTPMDEESDFLAGGFTEAGTASDNKLTITGGSLLGNFALYGGYGTTGSTGNSVTLASSLNGSEIIGGYTSSGTASGNTIDLTGGTISTSGIIAGGYTADGAATGNTINIKDNAVLNGTMSLYGGYGTTSTGNTINVYSKGNVVGGVDYFQKLYIAPEASLTIGNTDTTGNAASLTVKNGTTVDAQGALYITGDLSADAATVTAANATIGGSVSATNKATVSLGGSDLKLSTVKVDDSSTLTLNGGTLTATKLSDAITGGGKVTLAGTATLATTADQIFTDANTTETTAASTNTLTDTAKNSVIFKAGTLSLNNDYSYAYLTNIQSIMNGLDDSATSLIMTGDLVDTTGISDSISVASASVIGSKVALDTVTAATNDQNLVIGGTAADTNTTAVSQGFSVAALDLGSASSVTVTGGQSLTLGGSGTTDVISTTSDNAEVSLTDGSSLTIGNSTVGADQTLNVNASVAATDSTVTTNGQTNIEGTVTLTNSTIQANTGTLTVAQDLTTGGTSTITGSVAVAGDIVATAAADGTTATLNVGTDTTAAAVSAKSASLSGGTLYLDPIWQNGGTIGDGSKAALGSVSDAKLVVGNNSTLTLGSTDTSLAEKAFADTGLSWGSDGILSALYVNSSQSLSNNSIVVDSAASSTSGTEYGIFTMGANSLLMVNGNAVTSTAALTNVKSVSMDSSAKLYIDGATSSTTYNILSAASGGDVKTDNTWYADANAATKNILTNNQLLKFIGADGNGTSQFSVTAIAQDASDVYGKAIIDPTVVNAAVAGSGASADFFNNAVNNQVNTTKAQQANAINSQAAMTELGGVQHGLYTANNLFDSAVMNHLADLDQADKDKDIWAHYIHSKEDIDGLSLDTLGGASYKAQYNGVIVGSDFYTKGNAVAGAAFTYMDGSIDGNTATATTKNDADYYGLSFYGRLTQGRTNYLGDISWLHGKNDLTQYNSLTELTGSVSSNAFSAGVRAEQNFTAGKGLLTPYIGLRYAHFDFGDYTDSIGVHHDADTANIWLLPVGLRYSLTSQHGSWSLKPIAEVGYLWTLGDRDGVETVSLNGQANAFGFDLADPGTYYGRLGVEAQKGDITYGIGYQYQKGDSVRSNTWMAAVRYKF